MFKQRKEPREEGKARVQVSNKTHGSMLCAELSAASLSYSGVNMSNG